MVAVSGERIGTGTAFNAAASTATNDLVARNSTRLGLDTRSLAADLSDLAPEQLQASLASLASSLTPVQQGELLRAFDDQRSAPAAGPADGPDQPNPFTDFIDQVVDAIRGVFGGGGSVSGSGAVDAPLDVDGVLGADAAALAAQSPTLTREMQALENDGWTIEVGAAGGGSYADRGARTITIDGNEIGNAPALVQTLAHEVGHARYTPTTDTSSRDAYLRSALADEGAATLSNIRVQREILAAGGADIGIAGNPANHAAYNAAYDQLLADGNEVAARDAIGAIFGNGERTSTTGETYADYYGGWYDRNFPAP